MGKYVLSENEINDVKSIIKVASSASTLYKKLCDLEINKKENTEEYQKTLEYLDIVHEVQEKKYQTLNCKVARAMLDYIVGDSISKDFLEDTESIMRQDYHNRSNRRVLISLCEIINNDLPVKESMVLKAIRETDKNINTLMLNFLNEYIRKSDDRIRPLLIEAKYNLIFINEHLEEELVKENIIEENPITLESKSVNGLYHYVSSLFMSKQSKKEMFEILETYDDEYDDSVAYTSAILRLCRLRSILSLLDNDIIEEITSNYHEILGIYDTDSDAKSNDKSRELLKSAFLSVVNDKKKYK